MAKVKIQGNASGTGVITLIAPATDTNRTITLPDESITLGAAVDTQTTAKAWINFNGTAAAASMIRDSHNVSSITDNGTGNYTVNFSSAMANTSYSVHGTVGGDTGNGSLHAFEVHVNGYSTSSSKVLSAYVATSSANRTQYDESYMNVLYFGD
jgi:hypothetical protein